MDIKQVIVIRTKFPDGHGGTTGVRKGKLIAQGAHASMAFLINRIRKSLLTPFDEATLDELLEISVAEKEWLEGSFAKVTLQVDTEEDLQKVYQDAKDANLMVELIVDSGRTEFDGVPTATCLAIGPDDAEKIDVVTGDLRLY